MISNKTLVKADIIWSRAKVEIIYSRVKGDIILKKSKVFTP